MAIRVASSLHRNRYGILYFRMAVPADLQHRFASKEIYRSLRTASIKDATVAAQTLSIALRQTFTEIRQQPMSDQKETFTAPLLTLDDVLNTARKDLYLRARIEELEQTVDVLQDTQRAEKKRHNETLAIVTKAAMREPKKPSPLFSQLIEDYRDDRRTGKKWTQATEKENLAIYKLFIEIIGDLPIADIDDDHARKYLATLQQLPRNMNKMPEYRGKTLHEIIALNHEPISTRSINKNLERISSLFKFATSKRKYDLKYNPFNGLSLDDSKAKKREPFTVDELVRLFGAAEHAQRKYKSAYAYWLPIMGLFTGARLNELCQLHLADFEVIDGIHCINIRDEEEGQRVKNKNARRLIPIHDQLIEVGLVRYVERLRAEGQERLFPTLRFYEKGGYGKKPSEWFGQFRRRCGITENHTKAFHSFRHTFISSLLSDGVPELLVAQVVGHEGDLITSQAYWNEKAPAKRKSTVDRFQPPAEVCKLIPKFEEITIGKGGTTNSTRRN